MPGLSAASVLTLTRVEETAQTLEFIVKVLQVYKTMLINGLLRLAIMLYVWFIVLSMNTSNLGVWFFALGSS